MLYPRWINSNDTSKLIDLHFQIVSPNTLSPQLPKGNPCQFNPMDVLGFI